MANNIPISRRAVGENRQLHDFVLLKPLLDQCKGDPNLSGVLTIHRFQHVSTLDSIKLQCVRFTITHREKWKINIITFT